MVDLEQSKDNGTQRQNLPMGTDQQCLGLDLLEQVAFASLPKNRRNREGILKVRSFFKDVQPENLVEAMVYGQLYALNSHAMALMNDAQRAPAIDIREQYLKAANRLLRTFNTAIDTLGRFRRQGHQVIRVETVNVNEGGRAIVGGAFENGKDRG